MTRPRPGSAATQRGGKLTHRIVPPSSARRGINTQKSDKVRLDRKRDRRTGIFRRTFGLLRAMLLTMFVTGGLGAAGWAGWRAFETNSFLALRQVDVVGNKLVARSEILEKAGLELGTKLPSVGVAGVEASLKSLSGLGDVEVRRIFPSRIEIRVREKEPVAMGYARGWYGLAADGARIAGLDLSQSDLPIIDGFANLDSSDRRALGGFLDGAKREHVDLYANFSQIGLRGSDGIEIVLRDGSLKVLLILKTKTLSGNKSLNSLEFLQALMHQQSSELAAGKTVDLRVDGYAYVR